MPHVLLVPDLPLEHWPSMDRYAHRLFNALKQAGSDVELSLANDIDEERPAPLIRSSTPHDLPVNPKFGWQDLRRHYTRYRTYPRRVRHMQADVMHVLDHSYAHMIRAKRNAASIVSVHDMMPVLAVQRKATRIREHVQHRALQWILNNLRQADGYIVATEWMREQLSEWLGSGDNIFVVPYGVDERFFNEPTESPDSTRQRWGIPPNSFVVLHIGSVGPRKNFNTVIAAVDGLGRAGLDARLLQVGGNLSREQLAEVEARDLKDHVTTLGVTNESELRAAYRAANVLLFPSLYEGFGSPVLEAMASELPVISSGAGGLTEVGGDAAVVVGGREVEPYVKAIERIHNDEAMRKELIRKGVENARKYTWPEAARKAAAVYESVA